MQEVKREVKPVLVPEAELHVAHASLIANRAKTSVSRRASLGADLRFTIVDPKDLLVGRPEAAALGLSALLRVPDAELHEGLINGVATIRREINDFGTPEDKECLEYILHQPAGSSSRAFANGVRDEGRHGELLSDFVQHPTSVASRLSEAHVLALRLYTSAAYNSINTPLRDQSRTAPHPFPVTVYLIAEALKRLRSCAGEQVGARGAVALWRGMRSMRVTEEFMREGGSELAPMSTSSQLAVALSYALSREDEAPGEDLLLFKIVTKSFMERGVDLSYLSCFPAEAEHLYPPLTYLHASGNTQSVELSDGSVVHVVEVEPTFGT